MRVSRELTEYTYMDSKTQRKQRNNAYHTAVPWLKPANGLFSSQTGLSPQFWQFDSQICVKSNLHCRLHFCRCSLKTCSTAHEALMANNLEATLRKSQSGMGLYGCDKQLTVPQQSPNVWETTIWGTNTAASASDKKVLRLWHQYCITLNRRTCLNKCTPLYFVGL